jgi:hypothetical protein
MDNQTFENLLNALRTEAKDTFNLADRARLAQYRHLGHTYIVYRQLTQAPQLLAEAYRAAGIKTPATQQNSPKFRPFLKLIYGIDIVSPVMNNTLTRYSAVLGQLDEEYLRNESFYAVDPVVRLAAYIEKQGGITAMHEAAKATGLDVPQQQDSNDPALSPAATKRKHDAVLAKQQAGEELAKRRLHALAHTQLPPIAEFKPTQPISHNEQKLVALIARVEADGSLKVLASSCAADAVNAVAANVKAKEFGGVSPALAVLAETVSLQAFPAHAKPKGAEGHAAWRDRVFYDRVTSAKSADKANTSGEPQTTPRRLMFCTKSKALVMSNKGRSRGVTIIAKPKAMQMPASDQYLMTRQRWELEQLVASGQIELLRAKTDDRLLPVEGQLHSHVLDLENMGTGETQRLHFYERGRSRDSAANNWQGTIDPTSFKPVWSASVDTGFFETLREKHFDLFFQTLGRNGQIKRGNNRETNLTVAKDLLTLDFNQQTVGDTPTVSVPFSAKLATGADSLVYRFRTKDLAAVFYNLAEVAATGPITLKGNADALLITFNTNVAVYTIAIPTLCNAAPVNTIFKKGA